MEYNYHVFLYYLMLADMFPKNSEERLCSLQLILCEFARGICPVKDK